MAYHINQHQFPSKQVYLNSKYADAYGGIPSYKSWCFFNFKEPIVNLPQAYEFLISLNSCEFPLSFPIVNSSNNVFMISVNVLDASGNKLNFSNAYTLPSGNYSVKDVADFVSSRPSFLWGNITLTYSGTTNRFIFELNLLDLQYTYLNFSILPGTSNSVFGLSGAQLSTSVPDAIAVDIHGYPVFRIQSDTGVDLSGTRAIFIKCLSIHTAGYDSRTKYSSTILARIPLTQEPLSIQWYSNITQFKAKCVIKNISNLEMQICDEDGNLIDFNTLDWTCTLQLDVIAQSPTDFTPDVPFQ